MTSPSTLAPDEAIAEATALLRGTPVFMAGSCVAAQAHGKSDGFSDLDLFVPTQQILISTIQTLLDHGYVIDERFDRVWHRWLRFGLRGWHTNSMRLQSLQGMETNVVFKIVDGHPTTSLGQVLESFDFGLLGMGYDLESDTFRDMRPFLFPDIPSNQPLPLMPSKRYGWINGFISQYNGLREGGRYAKYHQYGYDMTAVKSDLIQGYRMVASYHATSDDEDKQLLSTIYQAIADKIDDDQIDELYTSYQQINFNDPLAEILESLE